MPRRTYDYLCQTCEFRNFHIFDVGEAPDELDCDVCGNVMIQVIGAPAVLRASYHDGYQRGGGYNLLKEAAKVESQMYNLPPEKRQEHKKHIRDLKKATAKEKNKS